MYARSLIIETQMLNLTVYAQEDDHEEEHYGPQWADGKLGQCLWIRNESQAWSYSKSGKSRDMISRRPQKVCYLANTVGVYLSSSLFMHSHAYCCRERE